MTLTVYERDASHYFCPRKQVISYGQSDLVFDERLYLTGSLIPLVLMGDTKTILGLWLSPFQVSRLAKYLRTEKWDGGFTMCPWKSWPRVTIHAISEMPELMGDPLENKRRTECGLAFSLEGSNTIIEWIPEDRETVSKSLAELAKRSYELRIQEAEVREPQIDIEVWKRHLFST